MFFPHRRGIYRSGFLFCSHRSQLLCRVQLGLHSWRPLFIEEYPDALAAADLIWVGLDFPSFSGMVDVDGEWDLEVIDGRVVFVDGILCGRFVTGDIFHGVSSASMFEASVLFFVSSEMLMLSTVTPFSVPTTYLLMFSGSLVGIPVIAYSPELLSLQDGDGVCTISFFVRLDVHLLTWMGLCSSIPYVGLLLVVWSLLMRRPTSEPGNDVETAICRWLMRSTIRRHILDVSLMGPLNFDEDSSSIRNSASSFILDLLLCWRWRRTGLRRQRPATAKATGCSSRGLRCIFSFIEEYSYSLGIWM